MLLQPFLRLLLSGKPQQLFAHKCVLAARSPTFMRLLTGDAIEKVAMLGEFFEFLLLLYLVRCVLFVFCFANEIL